MTGQGFKNLITDIKGLRVGQAECPSVLTGVSVLICDFPFNAAVSVLGGGPGTRETDALRPDRLVDQINALVFSGGSVYGLAAADRLTNLLGAKNQGYGLNTHRAIPKSPIIPAAILYDLANGGDKNWGESPPYYDLARTACLNADSSFELGCHGAGMGAVAGQLKGGVGSASFETEDGMCVGALSCVNSFGSVTGSDGVFYAKIYEQKNEFGGYWREGREQITLDLLDQSLEKRAPGLRENTTLCVIAVNADLSPVELKQISQMAATGLARAIRPVFTPFDGDIVFALSNGQKQIKKTGLARVGLVAKLGGLAADCLARAIARGVYHAESLGGFQSWQDRYGSQKKKP